MVSSFRYAQANGIMKDSAYPYVKYAGTCKYQNAETVVRNAGYGIPYSSVSALMAQVAIQPVSVGISASSSVMQNYVSGIITGTSCGTTIDHGVVIVGYGTSCCTDYWIVRNSWGT